MSDLLIAIIASLTTAFLWSVGSLISLWPAREFGGFTLNRIRMVTTGIMLVLFCGLTDRYMGLDISLWWLIFLTSFIGIYLGDTALFLGLQMMGPRRNIIIFSTHAPMTVLLAWVFLGDQLSPFAILGCALVTIGAIIAIWWGYKEPIKTAVSPINSRYINSSQASQFSQQNLEKIEGKIKIAILLALIAAFCQAIGILLAKPLLERDIDPIALASLRVVIAALALVVTGLLPFKMFKSKAKMTLKGFSIIFISGFIGMGLGMPLIMIALTYGSAGIVATLSSAQPVMVLPLIWLISKQPPLWPAWVGAVLVVMGIGFISL